MSSRPLSDFPNNPRDNQTSPASTPNQSTTLLINTPQQAIQLPPTPKNTTIPMFGTPDSASSLPGGQQSRLTLPNSRLQGSQSNSATSRRSFSSTQITNSSPSGITIVRQSPSSSTPTRSASISLSQSQQISNLISSSPHADRTIPKYSKKVTPGIPLPNRPHTSLSFSTFPTGTPLVAKSLSAKDLTPTSSNSSTNSLNKDNYIDLLPTSHANFDSMNSTTSTNQGMLNNGGGSRLSRSVSHNFATYNAPQLHIPPLSTSSNPNTNPSLDKTTSFTSLNPSTNIHIHQSKPIFTQTKDMTYIRPFNEKKMYDALAKAIEQRAEVYYYDAESDDDDKSDDQRTPLTSTPKRSNRRNSIAPLSNLIQSIPHAVVHEPPQSFETPQSTPKLAPREWIPGPDHLQKVPTKSALKRSAKEQYKVDDLFFPDANVQQITVYNSRIVDWLYLFNEHNQNSNELSNFSRQSTQSFESPMTPLIHNSQPAPLSSPQTSVVPPNSYDSPPPNGLSRSETIQISTPQFAIQPHLVKSKSGISAINIPCFTPGHLPLSTPSFIPPFSLVPRTSSTEMNDQAQATTPLQQFHLFSQSSQPSQPSQPDSTNIPLASLNTSVDIEPLFERTKLHHLQLIVTEKLSQHRRLQTINQFKRDISAIQLFTTQTTAFLDRLEFNPTSQTAPNSNPAALTPGAQGIEVISTQHINQMKLKLPKLIQQLEENVVEKFQPLLQLLQTTTCEDLSPYKITILMKHIDEQINSQSVAKPAEIRFNLNEISKNTLPLISLSHPIENRSLFRHTLSILINELNESRISFLAMIQRAKRYELELRAGQTTQPASLTTSLPSGYLLQSETNITNLTTPQKRKNIDLSLATPRRITSTTPTPTTTTTTAVGSDFQLSTPILETIIFTTPTSISYPKPPLTPKQAVLLAQQQATVRSQDTKSLGKLLSTQYQLFENEKAHDSDPTPHDSDPTPPHLKSPKMKPKGLGVKAAAQKTMKNTTENLPTSDSTFQTPASTTSTSTTTMTNTNTTPTKSKKKDTVITMSPIPQTPKKKAPGSTRTTLIPSTPSTRSTSSIIATTPTPAIATTTLSPNTTQNTPLLLTPRQRPKIPTITLIPSTPNKKLYQSPSTSLALAVQSTRSRPLPFTSSITDGLFQQTILDENSIAYAKRMQELEAEIVQIQNRIKSLEARIATIAVDIYELEGTYISITKQIEVQNLEKRAQYFKAVVEYNFIIVQMEPIVIEIKRNIDDLIQRAGITTIKLLYDLNDFTNPFIGSNEPSDPRPIASNIPLLCIDPNSYTYDTISPQFDANTVKSILNNVCYVDCFNQKFTLPKFLNATDNSLILLDSDDIYSIIAKLYHNNDNINASLIFKHLKRSKTKIQVQPNTNPISTTNFALTGRKPLSHLALTEEQLQEEALAIVSVDNSISKIDVLNTMEEEDDSFTLPDLSPAPKQFKQLRFLFVDTLVEPAVLVSRSMARSMQSQSSRPAMIDLNVPPKRRVISTPIRSVKTTPKQSSIGFIAHSNTSRLPGPRFQTQLRNSQFDTKPFIDELVEQQNPPNPTTSGRLSRHNTPQSSTAFLNANKNPNGNGIKIEFQTSLVAPEFLRKYGVPVANDVNDDESQMFDLSDNSDSVFNDHNQSTLISTPTKAKGKKNAIANRQRTPSSAPGSQKQSCHLKRSITQSLLEELESDAVVQIIKNDPTPYLLSRSQSSQRDSQDSTRMLDTLSPISEQEISTELLGIEDSNFLIYDRTFMVSLPVTERNSTLVPSGRNEFAGPKRGIISNGVRGRNRLGQNQSNNNSRQVNSATTTTTQGIVGGGLNNSNAVLGLGGQLGGLIESSQSSFNSRFSFLNPNDTDKTVSYVNTSMSDNTLDSRAVHYFNMIQKTYETIVSSKSTHQSLCSDDFESTQSSHTVSPFLSTNQDGFSPVDHLMQVSSLTPSSNSFKSKLTLINPQRYHDDDSTHYSTNSVHTPLHGNTTSTTTSSQSSLFPSTSNILSPSETEIDTETEENQSDFLTSPSRLQNKKLSSTSVGIQQFGMPYVHEQEHLTKTQLTPKSKNLTFSTPYPPIALPTPPKIGSIHTISTKPSHSNDSLKFLPNMDFGSQHSPKATPQSSPPFTPHSNSTLTTTSPMKNSRLAPLDPLFRTNIASSSSHNGQQHSDQTSSHQSPIHSPMRTHPLPSRFQPLSTTNSATFKFISHFDDESSSTPPISTPNSPTPLPLAPLSIQDEPIIPLSSSRKRKAIPQPSTPLLSTPQQSPQSKQTQLSQELPSTPRVTRLSALRTQQVTTTNSELSKQASVKQKETIAPSTPKKQRHVATAAPTSKEANQLVQLKPLPTDLPMKTRSNRNLAVPPQ